MKKIGIFYINAGGGHRGPAKALVREIEENYQGQIEPVLVDALAGSGWWERWLIEKGYAYAVNNLPWLWRVIYWFGTRPLIIQLNEWLFYFSTSRYLRRIIRENKFDQVVSVHHLVNSAISRVLHKEKIQIPISCVVTDPHTVPPVWFSNKEIKYFVFTEKAKDSAIRAGVPGNNLILVPPLINKKFFSASLVEKKIFRNKLNWPGDKKIILVVGGGDGLRHGPDILRALIKLGNDIRIAVVCGRDMLFSWEAKRIAKKFPERFLAVLGFVENMEEMMGASDLIVSKAGASTVYEAALMQRPLLVTSYVWKQELGNKDYIVNNGLGVYEPSLKSLPAAAEKLLDSFDIQAHLKDHSSRMHPESGSKAIAEIIVKK